MKAERGREKSTEPGVSKNENLESREPRGESGEEGRSEAGGQRKGERGGKVSSLSTVALRCEQQEQG